MPGEDINARVHREVFGARILSGEEMRAEAVRVWKEQPLCRHFSSLGGFHAAPHPVIGGEPVVAQAIPNYSGDIREAWRVAMKVDAILYIEADSFSTTASFLANVGGDITEVGRACAPDPALAICKASLAAHAALSVCAPTSEGE